jgi:hypothetical protein
MNKLHKLFEAPKPTERPIRLLVYGFSKQGKSHLVFSSTEVGPLFWIDTERGSDFYPSDRGHGFRVRYDKDPKIALEAIEAAHELAMEGGPRPIVAIDSFSSVWFEQQEVAEHLTEEWGKGRDRAVFRAWGPAKKPLKRLYEMCHYALCHIIITARAKEEYKLNKKGEPEVVGIKPDIERNLPYAVDFIAELSVNPESAAPKPTDFIAKVVGTRTPPELGDRAISIGTIFRNPRFSDFIKAEMEGSLPEEIGTGVERQVDLALTAPKSWSEMVNRLKPSGYTEETIAAKLKEHFGSFDRERLDDYWEFMKEQDGRVAEEGE